MKVIGKLCGILVIAVSLISCSKEDVPNRLSDSSKCKVIGSDNVLKYANAKFGKTKGSAIIIDPVCVDNDTLAFILNYGEGWELISGDENEKSYYNFSNYNINIYIDSFALRVIL